MHSYKLTSYTISSYNKIISEIPRYNCRDFYATNMNAKLHSVYHITWTKGFRVIALDTDF